DSVGTSSSWGEVFIFAGKLISLLVSGCKAPAVPALIGPDSAFSCSVSAFFRFFAASVSLVLVAGAFFAAAGWEAIVSSFLSLSWTSGAGAEAGACSRRPLGALV